MSKDILIGEKYKMSRSHKLGSGSFGEIYLGKPAPAHSPGVHIKSGAKVAVKLESLRAKNTQLMYEAKVIKIMQGQRKLPPHSLTQPACPSSTGTESKANTT